MPRHDALPLPPRELDRLAKVAGLLASDQPGEVVAAATAATRILREYHLSWRDLVEAAAPAALEADWRHEVAECLAHPEMLTGWEVRFLRGLFRFARLSERQAGVLGKLRERIAAARGRP
jgi:hypothetical protein